MKAKLDELRKRLDHFSARSDLTVEQIAWGHCIEEAILAGEQGNYSVGALVTDSKFRILGRGRNAVFKPKFRSEAHAEMIAISAVETAASVVDKNNLILFSTLEPCLMCTARILLSGIGQAVFLKRDPTAGICDRLHMLPPNYQDLAKRVQFHEYNNDLELKEISSELYKIGEELWSREYGL